MKNNIMGKKKTKINAQIRKKQIPIGKIILYTVATAGILSMAVMAPNALQALKMFGFGKKRTYYPYQIKAAFNRLKQAGLISTEQKNGKSFVRLTQKGKKFLGRYMTKEKSIKKPLRWDKKWRVVIFDIKEKRRATRNMLRSELDNLGFVRLQNSVWVYPYHCEELIVLLKAHFKLGKDVLYLTVQKIENDVSLKKYFKLL
jgi:CRISPR-associated endonuclease Cas2